MSPIKTRFAPSPTGLIHIGNARTALFSALLGDQFLLRIEDTDLERSRPEFVDTLIEDLLWLGITWQEGPENRQPTEAFFQSQRASVYADYYHQLVTMQKAYPCYCTPTELEVSRKVQLSSGKPPRYSGRCADLNADHRQSLAGEGRAPTLRFRVPKGETITFEDGVRGPQRFQSDDIGDFIIQRADGTAAFFFCNALDDALMGVSQVMRGEDHLANTPRQIMILNALNLPVPSYAHSALILGDDGAPLSKRNGSLSIQELRQRGYFPIAVINLMARLGHHYESEELMELPALKKGFALHHVGRSPARFDQNHLNHWQSLALRQVSDMGLDAWLQEETHVLIPKSQAALFRDVVRSNCQNPFEAHDWARLLFTEEAFEVEAECKILADQAGEDFYRQALDAAASNPEDFTGFLSALKEASGAKGKALFMPLRAAFTGRHDGPELAQLYRLIEPSILNRRLALYLSPSH
jgi:glutamyl-tRNA synthetase